MEYNKSKKVLVILGAGHDQLPMYEIAKRRGMWIIGVDHNPKACAVGEADEFVQISTRDYTALKIYLKGRKIHGIISPASDAAHETIYQMSYKFDLSWKPSLKAVKGSYDKEYFLDQVSLLGIKVPKYHTANELQQIIDNIDLFNFPIISKPIDSSGSKGISFVTKINELEEAFKLAKEHSFSGRVIIEEYIKGDHFSAELFRQKGQTILIAISEKRLTGTDKFITLQHFVPARINDDLKEVVNDVLEIICNYLEINNGPVNFDFIIRGNEVYIIEMGARLAGNGMPSLIQYSYEVDTYEMALDLVMGNECAEYEGIIPAKRYSALHVIHSNTSGVLQEITGLDNLKIHAAIKEIKVFVKEGDKVASFEQADHKLGYIMVAHKDIEEVDKMLARADENIKINLREEN